VLPLNFPQRLYTAEN